MHLTLAQYLLGAVSGVFVGFTLGLVGGGGSILAVPLIVYLVGVSDPHLAIGTTAVAVAANAAINLVPHARKGKVKWRCAGTYAASGVVGAFLGSTLGKAIDGQKLLFLFALLMMVVGVLLLRRRQDTGDANVNLTRANAPKLAGAGFLTGGLSGFFGIGGGFLIVPGLMFATGMPIICAVGSSLLSVAAFGATTAANYAISGWVDWPLAGIFIAGGVAGGLGGTALAHHLSVRRGVLNKIFAGLIFVVALYVLYRSRAAF
ncbi:MAG TPA: sulfite exporter TauE/SafE family protein [Rhizomicrobium sp.]|jgi:hypothetical protein|nr:sulfite exporter TauE/SafE family protein [Rhizomicrobium sp.]